MNILVLFGSPHTRGTTDVLASAFAAGAAAAGHTVVRRDVAGLDIHPCLGCNHCRTHDGVCVYRDDMQALREQALAADTVVFVTPTYYFGICAQLKAVIDRFYAVNAQLRASAKRACLLAACGDGEEWAIQALEMNYAVICRYLGWENAGEVLAVGFNTREEILKTDYAARAEALGKGL